MKNNVKDKLNEQDVIVLDESRMLKLFYETEINCLRSSGAEELAQQREEELRRLLSDEVEDEDEDEYYEDDE